MDGFDKQVFIVINKSFTNDKMENGKVKYYFT